MLPFEQNHSARSPYRGNIVEPQPAYERRRWARGERRLAREEYGWTHLAIVIVVGFIGYFFLKPIFTGPKVDKIGDEVGYQSFATNVVNTITNLPQADSFGEDIQTRLKRIEETISQDEADRKEIREYIELKKMKSFFSGNYLSIKNVRSFLKPIDIYPAEELKKVDCLNQDTESLEKHLKRLIRSEASDAFDEEIDACSLCFTSKSAWVLFRVKETFRFGLLKLIISKVFSKGSYKIASSKLKDRRLPSKKRATRQEQKRKG